MDLTFVCAFFVAPVFLVSVGVLFGTVAFLATFFNCLTPVATLDMIVGRLARALISAADTR
jgi:hypothetical protein